MTEAKTMKATIAAILKLSEVDVNDKPVYMVLWQTNEYVNSESNDKKVIRLRLTHSMLSDLCKHYEVSAPLELLGRRARLSVNVKPFGQGEWITATGLKDILPGQAEPNVQAIPYTLRERTLMVLSKCMTFADGLENLRNMVIERQMTDARALHC